MTGPALAPAPGRIRERAAAKVNLFLHVGPVQPDGYHPIASWMVFADLGDILALEPADAWSFRVDGPFGDEIGPGENLVEKAARLLFHRAGTESPRLRLTLTKALPVAAGLGGGSSDAGAALRLLNSALPAPLPHAQLMSIAAELGADGPACLIGRPVLATGRGEVLAPAPTIPPLAAVLVNPARPSSTGAVYRAYDAESVRAADTPELPPHLHSTEAVAAILASTRNDLESPAVAQEPAIGDVLDRLRSQPEALLARMSGSGATCFALCRCDLEAQALAARLRALEPGWWTQPCALEGSITNS